MGQRHDRSLPRRWFHVALVGMARQKMASFSAVRRTQLCMWLWEVLARGCRLCKLIRMKEV